MTPGEAIAFLPHLVVATGALVVMLVISFHRNQTISALLTLGTLLAALATIPLAHAETPRAVGILLRVDGFGLYFIALMLAASIAVTIFSHSYLEKYRMERGEFYILLLLSVLGALVLATANHMVSFFLGLELLSISLYVMVGYIFMKEKALEAAVKYLFLAAATTAFLLFGMALLYARMGTMEFEEIAALVNLGGIKDPYLLAGLAMIFVGVGFKLSVVPFHQWTPDIYQGSPAPVTAFLATVSKGAVLAVVIRFFHQTEILQHPGVFTALAVVAVASMTVGNLLALMQENIKRILAYSSIAHFGYIFVAFLAGGSLAMEAVMFYLTAYFIMVLGAFGVVGYLTPGDSEADTVEDYRGIFWSRPGAATALATMLFSLIGLPLTAGFMGKLFLVSAGIEGRQWFLVLWLVLNSAVGLYYYLRIIIAMYSPPESPQGSTTSTPPFAISIGVVLALLSLAILWIGVHPASLLEWIRLLGNLP